MELIPKLGIGPIRFKMSPAQIESILGSHRTFEDWMGGNLNDALLYPGLVICFSQNDAFGPLPDSQVREIWIHPNNPTTLAGQDVFSLYVKDIESYLKGNGVQYDKHEDKDYLWIPEFGWELSFDDDQRIEFIKIFDPSPV
jgi:hypothetical protein